ncbi:uncharacterized protein AMSG_10567 [Thecamonas trahens ATCC 50062]|uniref:Uncharacterized protein n=1 Tax=Thecamonas trahens ATCC 50062 TaxID=461836 RepID=A0A0L0DTV4_THETB|nr:hypothetical protein AMSG_10567 [Thecamonas trahens ATCC 50062]KNC54908.1 hypothetical protein AMSG_10567 [Thecamonas trahens ATCC 50062]|eukprot:XP_013753498.1 hypothetical protein AMSG_10567 [Thecamonas trahens ATCC 50062]
MILWTSSDGEYEYEYEYEHVNVPVDYPSDAGFPPAVGAKGYPVSDSEMDSLDHELMTANVESDGTVTARCNDDDPFPNEDTMLDDIRDIIDDVEPSTTDFDPDGDASSVASSETVACASDDFQDQHDAMALLRADSAVATDRPSLSPPAQNLGGDDSLQLSPISDSIPPRYQTVTCDITEVTAEVFGDHTASTSSDDPFESDDDPAALEAAVARRAQEIKNALGGHSLFSTRSSPPVPGPSSYVLASTLFPPRASSLDASRFSFLTSVPPPSRLSPPRNVSAPPPRASLFSDLDATRLPPRPRSPRLERSSLPPVPRSSIFINHDVRSSPPSTSSSQRTQLFASRESVPRSVAPSAVLDTVPVRGPSSRVAVLAEPELSDKEARLLAQLEAARAELEAERARFRDMMIRMPREALAARLSPPTLGVGDAGLGLASHHEVDRKLSDAWSSFTGR